MFEREVGAVQRPACLQALSRPTLSQELPRTSYTSADSYRNGLSHSQHDEGGIFSSYKLVTLVSESENRVNAYLYAGPIVQSQVEFIQYGYFQSGDSCDKIFNNLKSPCSRK